jgi:hypothetical protein
MRGIAVKFDYATPDELGVRIATGTVAGAPVTEHQYITEAYYPGDIITGRYGPTPYTYEVEDPDDEDNTLNQTIMWTDSNEGSRMWAWDQAQDS